MGLAGVSGRRGLAAERVLNALELGIPNGTESPERMRRIRILSIATLALIAIGILAIGQYLWLRQPHMVLAISATVVAAIGNLVLLRATRNPELCSHLGLVLLGGLLVLTTVTSGGFYDPDFAWLYLLPMTAALVVDLRGAAAWTGITLLLALGFWALPELGHSLPNLVPEALRSESALFSRLTAILAISLVAGSFVVGQRRAEHQLAQANDDLSRETAYVQLMQHAAASANEATSFEEAMADGIARICTTMGWAGGHFCWVSEDGRVTSSGRYHVDDPARLDAVRDRPDSKPEMEGSNLPARAVASGRPERIEFFGSDANVDTGSASARERRQVARAIGLKSAFAVPVFASGRIRAVLEFGSTEAAPQGDRVIEVMAHIAAQLGRVAERTALRERVERARKLEAVGQLAAGLAHEINNPMSYVRSNLHQMLREWEGLRASIEKPDVEADADSFDLCEELLEESLEGIERAVGIVREVQDFAHVGSEKSPIDPAALIDEAVRVAAARAPDDLRIEQCVEVVPNLMGTVDQLRQVLVNLIVNAVQATGAGGHVRASCTVEGRSAVFRVEDDGPGIEPAARDRLFEPFFTTKIVGEGTGLGLYISYEIAENHGGEIRIGRSSLGGAAFDLRIPLDGGPIDQSTSTR